VKGSEDKESLKRGTGRKRVKEGQREDGWGGLQGRVRERKRRERDITRGRSKIHYICYGENKICELKKKEVYYMKMYMSQD